MYPRHTFEPSKLYIFFLVHNIIQLKLAIPFFFFFKSKNLRFTNSSEMGNVKGKFLIFANAYHAV